MAYAHISVLADAVLRIFQEPSFQLIVDGTLGLGGHTEALLKQDPARRVIGIEWDPEALATARERLAAFGDRFVGIEGSYADMKILLQQQSAGPVNDVLLDLGLSSKQLADESRGFSFNAEGPLDMRMSPGLPETAWDLLKTRSEEELADIFYQYGEERFSRRIAAAIKDAIAHGLTNYANDVANVIRAAIPKGRPQGMDAATRCFQALRIAVNGELANVDRILEALPDLLAPGGRAAIISFHSLEDRANARRICRNVSAEKNRGEKP